MILVMGRARVRADAMDAVRDAMKAMMRATLKEEGCVTYNLCEDLFEPGLIRISEEWETMPALEAHFETAHMKVWRDALGAADMSDRNVGIYDGTLLKTV